MGRNSGLQILWRGSVILPPVFRTHSHNEILELSTGRLFSFSLIFCFIFMCKGVVPECVSVHYFPAWFPLRSKEGVKLPLIWWSCHMGVGMKPGSSALNYWTISLAPVCKVDIHCLVHTVHTECACARWQGVGKAKTNRAHLQQEIGDSFLPSVVTYKFSLANYTVYTSSSASLPQFCDKVLAEIKLGGAWWCKPAPGQRSGQVSVGWRLAWSTKKSLGYPGLRSPCLKI